MTKFVLLSTQKSGSAYIRSALSSYPGIKCHGELFQDISSMDNNTPHYSISFHKSLSNSILKRFFIKISKRIIDIIKINLPRIERIKISLVTLKRMIFNMMINNR